MKPQFARFKWRGFTVEAEGYSDGELTDLTLYHDNGTKVSLLDAFSELEPVPDDWSKVYNPMNKITELFIETLESNYYDRAADAAESMYEFKAGK